MNQEVKKTTDLELLQSFIADEEGIFVGENLQLRFFGSTRKIYYKKTVVATLELQGKILTATIDHNFLFFPEVDRLLRELGFFRLTTDTKDAAVYSSYTPKNYRPQYTSPDTLWRAWILNHSAKKREKLFFLHNEEWFEIEDMSFYGTYYSVSFTTGEQIETPNAAKTLWCDRKPSSNIRIYSSTIRSYTTVPLFRRQQIPSILEIEVAGTISTEDFWRVVHALNDKVETGEKKYIRLEAKYNRAKEVFQVLKTELTTWQKREETLREQMKALEARLARRDAKILLYQQSIEMYRKAIEASKITLPKDFQ